jgi:hypothetical protein
MRLPAPLPGVTVALLLVANLAFAQTTPPPQPPSQTTPTAPLDYVFDDSAGMLFFHVQPAKAGDFEAIATRLLELLSRSDDPVRRRQAEGWKVFRSVEGHANRIYVFVLEPVVSGADYDPVKVLTAEAPDQVEALYARLKEAVVRIERMGLARVRN